MKVPYFSVIVPVYNEEGNLVPLTERIYDVMKKLQKSWEFIIINDGSRDKSERILADLKKKYKEIVLLTFTRNYGQTAAFAAGIDHAKGSILITLDSDLQNDPADIPEMIKDLDSHHADIVCGWRKNRHDPFVRTWLSQCANWMINRFFNSRIHDLGCSLRIYKRDVVKNMELYGEMHRFIPVLASSAGAKVIERVVAHHPRKSGTSKYGFSRTMKVMLDVLTLKYLTAYQTKPIYIFGFVGIFLIILSVFTGLWVIVRRVYLGGEWVSPMLFIMTILFNSGVICILMGLLAEIQMRAWYGGSKKKSYSLKEI